MKYKIIDLYDPESTYEMSTSVTTDSAGAPKIGYCGKPAVKSIAFIGYPGICQECLDSLLSSQRAIMA